MNNCKFCNNTRREPGIPGPCAWCEVRSTPVICMDPGKPGSDMTVTAEFSQKDGRLTLVSLTHSEPSGKSCAASLGGVHCQASRANGSLFCTRHRHADSRQYRAPLTNEGLAFMMQRDGEQQ